jgi:hypothetical protein
MAAISTSHAPIVRSRHAFAGSPGNHLQDTGCNPLKKRAPNGHVVAA